MKISGFAQEKIFSNIFYATVAAILEEFESANQLAAFIQKHGKDSLGDGNSIVAKIGDINRFPFQASLAKYAGLTWIQHHPLDFSP